MAKTIWFFAEGAWHQVALPTIPVDVETGIFFDIDNIGNFLQIHTDTDPGISLTDGSDTAGIQIYHNGNGQINIQNTGGEGGIHIENDGGHTANDAQAGIYFEDNGEGGIVMLATGGGDGYANGKLQFLCYGGQTLMHNADEGIILYSTGQFTDGRLTDFTSLTGDSAPPGMVLAAAEGVVIAQGAPTGEFGSLNSVFIYTYTGGPNSLVLPATFNQTTDPGVDMAVWNDGGTVVFSGSTAGGGGGGSGIQFVTDPQTGNWLIVTSQSTTTRTWQDFSDSTNHGYGMVLEAAPVGSSGRGTLIYATGDGSPQLHALDLSIDVSNGVGKALFINAHGTGTPSLIIGGDVSIQHSQAGSTVGWRSFIQTDDENEAVGLSANAVTGGTGEGNATGGFFFGSANSDGNGTGVFSQSSSAGIGESVGIESVAVANGSGTAYGIRVHSAAGGTSEAYGMHLRLNQTGGTDRLFPVYIEVNGTTIFTLDPDGNLHLLTGASVHSDL